jgi:hypothetical protein
LSFDQPFLEAWAKAAKKGENKSQGLFNKKIFT